jgi:hypothetical protein
MSLKVEAPEAQQTALDEFVSLAKQLREAVGAHAIAHERLKRATSEECRLRTQVEETRARLYKAFEVERPRPPGTVPETPET